MRSTHRISVDLELFHQLLSSLRDCENVQDERNGDRAFENPKVLLTLALTQSDLRVRHREETKNVTRLTMENVSVLLS